MVRPISIEEFEAVRHPRGSGPSPLRQAIQALQPGEALAYAHTCERKGGKTFCNKRQTAVDETARNTKGYTYRTNHLPNGDLGVACYAKGGRPS